MQTVISGSRIFRFGTFELDGHAGELRKQGVRIRLQDQPLRILEMLLTSRGQIVTREELRVALWPANTFVGFDHGLNKAINKLREALGDSAESPRFIETLAKRGYRFLEDLKSDSSQIRSLLVLPLENLSRDPEQGYFADGLTEALTTTLAKIGALRVLARTTAVFYRRAQKTLPEIARELGVDEVVEGSVLRSQGRVRITVQLVHASTDTHLWAESYERDMRDILALQAEVTGAIVREIQVKITPHEQTQIARAPAVDPEAYDAYLRGRCYVDKRTPDANRKAIKSFEQALASDPNFALARAGLAECFNVLGWYGYVAPTEGCAKAKAMALQALETDPDLSQAHAALAWAVQYYDYDFLTAQQEFLRAIELDPRYPVAHYRYAMALTYVGRFDEAIAEAKCAETLEPFSATPNAALCWAYFHAGQHNELLAHAKRYVDLHPDVPHSHWALGVSFQESRNFDGAIAEFRSAVECSGGAAVFLAMLSETFALAGRRNDALKVLEQLQNRSSEQYVTPYMIARIYAALDQREEALGWLETAYAGRAAWMVMLKWDPHLSSLRPDPRFQALVQQMTFPS